MRPAHGYPGWARRGVTSRQHDHRARNVVKACGGRNRTSRARVFYVERTPLRRSSRRTKFDAHQHNCSHCGRARGHHTAHRFRCRPGVASRGHPALVAGRRRPKLCGHRQQSHARRRWPRRRDFPRTPPERPAGTNIPIPRMATTSATRTKLDFERAHFRAWVFRGATVVYLQVPLSPPWPEGLQVTSWAGNPPTAHGTADGQPRDCHSSLSSARSLMASLLAPFTLSK